MSGIFEELSGARGIREDAGSAADIAIFNAKVEEARAEGIRTKAGFAQARQAKAGKAAEGTLIAKLGSAGGIGSPVAAELIGEQAEELELENLLIGFEGEVLAQQAETQAELDLLQAKFIKQKGKNAARSANVQFGTQILLGGLALGGGGPTGPQPTQAGIPNFGTFA